MQGRWGLESQAGQDNCLITHSEVLLVLSKWRDESTPLRVTARFLGCGFDIVGTVSKIGQDSTVTLSLPDEHSKAFIQISSDLRFDYTEPVNLAENERTVAGIVHGASLVGVSETQKAITFSEIEEP